MALQQGLCLLLLSGVVGCLAIPVEHFRPQRQLFNPDYPFVPALAPQRFGPPPAPLQDPYYYPVAGAYNVPPQLKQVQYGPPQIQYGILPAPPAPSQIRYAPALVASNGQQQVIFTPPGPHSFLPSNVVVYRPNKDESGNSEEGYVQSFLNFVNHYVWPQPQPAEEGPSGAESPAESEKPEKVQAGSSVAASAEKEDKKDEKKEVKKGEKKEEKKEDSVVLDRSAPQRFVVVGEPQFFGRFSGIPQTIRQPQLPAVNKGAVSSYLLFRNFPGAGEPQQDSDYPQGPSEVDFDAAQGSPGRAALSYQKLLAQANQKEVDDSASVVVEAASKDASEDAAQQSAASSSENSDSEKVDADEETGPTIAQVKPSAIALAGPGGVASASPVGTALVGPGGMALSSPTATAVAGPAGATPGGIAISPTANKALRTYHLANKNFAAFINP